MKYVKVRNATRDRELGQKIREAASFIDRAVGLLCTPALESGEGLWLHPCSSIHTFFMRYPIDVLYLDAEGTVLACLTLPPWKLSGGHRASRGVLELPSGTLRQSGTQPGDRLDIKDVN